MKHPAPIRWIVIMFLLLIGPALSQAMDNDSGVEEPQTPRVETVTTEPAKSTDIEAGFTYEDLTNGYAPWRREYVQFIRRVADRKVFYGSVERTNRYSQTDSGITAGGYYPLGERWTALAEVNASPTHNVLAVWSALAEIEHDFGRGWTGHAGVRYREYDTNNVGMGSFGVGRNIRRFRVRYTLYASSVAGAGVAITNRADGTYNYGNSVASLTAAFGKELENIVPSGVLSTNVRLINLNGTHWFARSWAVSYSLNWHDQGHLYTRQGLTLGLRYRL